MNAFFDNIEMKAMTYNDQKVKEWYHDGVLVYRSATPYHVLFTDYPLAKISSYLDNGTSKVLTEATGYTMSMRKNPDAGGYGNVKGSVLLPTQGCNKVAITYKCFDSSGLVINNTTIFNLFTSYKEDTYILDCSGDTFTLNLDLYEATGDNTAILYVTDIHFYYE